MVTAAPNPLETLAEALGPILDAQRSRQYATVFKHDTSSTSPISVGYSHGPGGLLTFPGVDPVIFNAAMGSRTLLSQIPAVPSLYTNPTYFTMTGVQDVTGAEADGPCDDAPIAGLMKGCLTTSVFGRYMRATPILELNRLGQRVDRADPLDLRLVGSPMAQSGPFSGLMSDAPPGDVFENEVSRKFWEMSIAFHRLLQNQLWMGSPVRNTGAGGYKEMTGLPVLVNTGYKDAETGAACAAMDSYVKDFGKVRIDSTAGASNIVRAITDMYYQVKDRAISMGLMPVRWVLAMRPQLFYELTSVWPCSYMTFRCMLDGTSANRNTVDASDMIALRDQMRSGEYLLIDGDRVDVILDDAIPETSNSTEAGVPSGCFATDIYLLPMSVVGGQSTLFMEYFQYQNPSLTDALGKMILGQIQGAFIVWPRQDNLCIQWQAKVEPRLVLRTPQLAARLDNVVYCPVQHVREPFPDDPYFVNGGKTYRAGPSYSNIWAS